MTKWLVMIVLSLMSIGFLIGRGTAPKPEPPKPIVIHKIHFGGRVIKQGDGMLLIKIPGGFAVREGEYYTFPAPNDTTMRTYMKLPPPKDDDK